MTIQRALRIPKNPKKPKKVQGREERREASQGMMEENQDFS